MKKFNKIFNNIFVILVMISNIIIMYNIIILDEQISNNYLFIGLSGLILFCTEIITREIKNNRNENI